jgi:hypothetical protein
VKKKKLYARFQKRVTIWMDNQERKAVERRMRPLLALFFAIVGVILLAGISFSMAIGQLWLALAFTAASIGFIGFGFVTKAKQRKREQSRS